MAAGTHDARYRRLIEALAEARRDAGITQVELASRLGRLQQFVSKYESGERRLDVVEFVDIARTLGVDPEPLIREIKES